MRFPPPSLPIPESPPGAADDPPLSDGVALQSRLLASMAYDPNQTILQLEFHDGTVYRYFQVPHQTYQDLFHADSKGAYFNRHIRSVFRCARLAARSIPPRPTPAVPR
jgi:hypothetical protein